MQNKTTEEKLAGSLTAKSTELIPFLPYLLQDFWELGSDPDVMSDLLRRHASVNRVLDLGCGKGAVSIRLAEEIGVTVKGIDITPEFIEVAKQKAAAPADVSELCSFEVGDITKAVHTEKDWDCVILGAVGDVLGDPLETLMLLKQTIKPGGMILIDEGYVKEKNSEVRYENYEYLTLEEWHEVIQKAGLEILEIVHATEEDTADFECEMKNIEQRANELAERHPEKRELFIEYIESQFAEYTDLNSDVVGITMALRKPNV